MSNFTPAWFKKGFFNKSLFCDDFLSIHQLLYSNGAFFTPDGLPIAPELLTKWYRLWRAEHPEFEQIVFHGLRHSSATYAHTQDKPRLELTEKIEANFYSQDLTPAAPQSRQNEKPEATKISGKEILEAIRLMDADERRELTRALFA